MGLPWGSFWGYLLRELGRQCYRLWRVSIGEKEEMLGRKRTCYKTLHAQGARYLEGVQIKRAKSAWVGSTSISGFISFQSLATSASCLWLCIFRNDDHLSRSISASQIVENSPSMKTLERLSGILRHK